MPGTVSRWIAWRFLKSYLILAASVVLVFVVIDVFVNVDRFSGGDGLLTAARRYGRMLPELFYMLSPFLTLLSALWVLSGLMRSNELVALASVGYSPRQVAYPMIGLALLLAPLDWADRELVLPALAELRRDHYLRDPWFVPRPIPDQREGVLTARRYWSASGHLELARYVRLTPDGRESWSLIGSRADYSEDAGGWVFTGGFRVTTANGEDTIERIPEEGALLQTGIRLSDVEAAIDSPAYLSAEQLREQIERTPAFKHLAVQYYERYTQPLAGVVLLLLSIPVVLGGEGGTATLLRFLASLGMGIGYFVLNMLSFELGGRGALSPGLAASLPLLTCGSVGAILIWRTR